MRLAVIPARGGSKRIPRKNIKQFCGKPIIAWSIEAAIQSTCFDKIVVSTDDEEIADIARDYGASVPFLRPKNLADDHTGTGVVISHAIQQLMDAGETPLQVCCLYPTAPFVNASDLKNGLTLLEHFQVDFALAVTSYAFPIQRAIRIQENRRIEMFQSHHFYTRSQDLEEAYHDAGQFCWGRVNAWLENKAAFLADTVPIILPRHRVQDIDTLEDWINAEWMFKALLQQSNSI
ncbi:MAG: pseudaminic acid cytidylyltransferase [Cohaesibacteraceae bacterium]|nr:pseudaminic acid cytidylyltransferase [Cohaesibacteraceae bacterium]